MRHTGSHEREVPIRRTVCTLAILASLAVTIPALAAPPDDLVRAKARFKCLDGGGAKVTLWVRNISDRDVTIFPDIHFLLTLINGDQHESGPIVFMTPVPDFAELTAHEVSRFVVPIGDAGGGEPGTDLSADRLRLRVETYLEGHEHPAVHRFVFPGCPPPTPPTVI